MSSEQKRKRSKMACLTCRDLKRRCDGAHPCGTCVRFEYDCVYHSNKNKKPAMWNWHPDPGNTLPRHSPQSNSTHEATEQANEQRNHKVQAQSLEANSGHAFFRNLIKRLDPKRKQGVHTFAWNAFLGCRQAKLPPMSMPITHILNRERMEQLARIYFNKIGITYGFLDRDKVFQDIRRRWHTDTVGDPLDDAILCGVAALGCLNSLIEADQVEVSSLESARVLLEKTAADPPCAKSIAAWILRVVYLRLAGTHYTAWMTSCSVMHMIERAGLNTDTRDESGIFVSEPGVDCDTRRRLVVVALHLNIWMSFDMGLTRVTFANHTMLMPEPKPGDYTTELMELLPLSVELDPEKKSSVDELQDALHTVLHREHTCPSSVLAQCNLTLCLCRRLRSMEAPLTDSDLENVLKITSKGIQAAQDALDSRTPWHHMAYIPFQVVCVLLAIDTASSMSQLREAMRCLHNVSTVYNTDAIQEAYRTARSLVMLHQRGKELYASALADILKDCPEHQPDPNTEVDASGLSVSADVANTPFKLDGPLEFDIDQYLNPEFFWNAALSNI